MPRTHWLIFIVNRRTDAWIYNLFDAATCESEQFDSLLVVKKQMNVSVSCVCSVIDNEFRHNIVKVVCRPTRLWPLESTATLTIGTDAWNTDVNLLNSMRFLPVTKLNRIYSLITNTWNSRNVLLWSFTLSIFPSKKQNALTSSALTELAELLLAVTLAITTDQYVRFLNVSDVNGSRRKVSVFFLSFLTLQ